MLTEADLDIELGVGDAHTHGTSSCTAAAEGSEAGAGAGGAGPCHGFEAEHRSGEWINAGHADNVFGGTTYGMGRAGESINIHTHTSRAF